jgi:peptide/nickel transport system substrate-binding protein
MQAAKLSKYYKGRFNHVDRIELTEDGGIKCRLDTAYEDFPMLMDIPIVKESEVEANYPLGTGPYIFEQTHTGARLRLRTNWWCSTTVLPLTATSIPLTVAESTNQIRDSFEFGTLDLACTDPGNENYADYRCDYEVWDCDTGILLYLVCNAKSNLFSNPLLRQALTHAIDRNALVEEFYRGFATATTLPAKPGSPFYNRSLAGRYAYDPDAFAAAVTEAQLSEGSEAILAVNGDDALRVRVAQRIADAFTAAGLPVRLEKVAEKDFQTFLKTGKYDLYLGQTKLSPNMDLSAFFSEGGNLSYGGLADTTLFALNQKALANKGNFYNLHEQIMKNGNLIPILFRSYAIYATRGTVTALTPARDHIFHYSTGRSLADALITE